MENLQRYVGWYLYATSTLGVTYYEIVGCTATQLKLYGVKKATINKRGGYVTVHGDNAHYKLIDKDGLQAVMEEFKKEDQERTERNNAIWDIMGNQRKLTATLKSVRGRKEPNAEFLKHINNQLKELIAEFQRHA